MKKIIPTSSTLLASLLAILLFSGCGTNMFKLGVGGAAGGAVSASLLGAVTDLIVDGEVNTYQLQRNMVSGALAGGTAGAVVGHQKYKTEEQVKAASTPPPPPAAEKDLVKKVGKDNYRALEDLVHYRHADAYKSATKAVKSNNQTYQEAGYAIQALVDLDRDNTDGMQEAISQLLQLDGAVKDAKAAEKGLKALQGELQDERKAQGIRPPKG